jgi:hypothetical protein
LRESTSANGERERVDRKSQVPWKDDVARQVEEICRTRRHNERERGETRGSFVMWKVFSCGDGIRGRWRTELDLNSGKPFDDEHRTTALRASPKIARTGGGDLLVGLWCRVEQLKAEWQGGGTFAIGQEAEVPDAHETFGEQMQEKAAQELIERERQQFLFVVVSGIAPTKRDFPVSKRDQAMVGDGHAMGVTTEIAKHMLWASKRSFRVNHPVFSEQ